MKLLSLFIGALAASLAPQVLASSSYRYPQDLSHTSNTTELHARKAKVDQCHTHAKWIRRCNLGQRPPYEISTFFSFEYFADPKGNDLKWLAPDSSKQGRWMESPMPLHIPDDPNGGPSTTNWGDAMSPPQYIEVNGKTFIATFWAEGEYKQDIKFMYNFDCVWNTTKAALNGCGQTFMGAWSQPSSIFAFCNSDKGKAEDLVATMDIYFDC